MDLSFDAGLMLWTLVTFGVLLLLLSRFAFKPLRRILEEREQTIRKSLEDAEKARQEARELLTLNEQKLAEAREETRHIINEGHRIVAGMRREAQDRAKTDADQIVNQARQDIERELQRAMEELKGTVANLSMRVARQVIRGKLDDEEHARLADEFVERLRKAHGPRT